MMNNKGNKEKTMSWWTVWKGIDFFFSCKIITVTGQLFPLLLIFANVKRWMKSICYISGMIKKSFFLIGCLDQFLSEFDTILLPLSFSELVQNFESLLCVYHIIRLKRYQQSRQPSMRKSTLKESCHWKLQPTPLCPLSDELWEQLMMTQGTDALFKPIFILHMNVWTRKYVLRLDSLR